MIRIQLNSLRKELSSLEPDAQEVDEPTADVTAAEARLRPWAILGPTGRCRYETRLEGPTQIETGSHDSMTRRLVWRVFSIAF